jgi:hypothetical protein
MQEMLVLGVTGPWRKADRFYNKIQGRTVLIRGENRRILQTSFRLMFYLQEIREENETWE